METYQAKYIRLVSCDENAARDVAQDLLERLQRPKGVLCIHWGNIPDVLRRLGDKIGRYVPQNQFEAALKETCMQHLASAERVTGEIRPFTNEGRAGLEFTLRFQNGERRQSVLLRLHHHPQYNNLCEPEIVSPRHEESTLLAQPPAQRPVNLRPVTREQLDRVQLNRLFAEALQRGEVFSQQVLEVLTGNAYLTGPKLLATLVYWKGRTTSAAAISASRDILKCAVRDRLRELAGTAREETWGADYRVLSSYIEQTLRRALVLQKESNGRSGAPTYIAVSEDRARFCFHTGLFKLAKDDYAIFAEFVRRPITGDPSEDAQSTRCWWNFEGWRTASELHGCYDPLPERVFYHETALQLVFNPAVDIQYNVKHILQDGGRDSRVRKVVPKELKTDHLTREETQELHQKLADSIERGKFHARQNYRVVVPHYFPRKQQVQLLLPLYFDTGETQPQLVLCLEARRRGSEESLPPRELHELDRDPDRFVYFGPTVLTLAMAYNNARLLFEVESNWLHYPEGEDEENEGDGGDYEFAQHYDGDDDDF